MDQSLKQEAENVFKEIGVDATTAVRMFYHKVIATRSIPFELKADKTERDAARLRFESLILEGMEGPFTDVTPGWADDAKKRLRERMKRTKRQSKRLSSSNEAGDLSRVPTSKRTTLPKIT